MRGPMTSPNGLAPAVLSTVTAPSNWPPVNVNFLVTTWFVGASVIANASSTVCPSAIVIGASVGISAPSAVRAVTAAVVWFRRALRSSSPVTARRSGAPIVASATGEISSSSPLSSARIFWPF